MGQGASKSARKQEEGLRCMYQAQEHLQAQNYGLARTSCTQGIKLLEEAVTFAEAADAGMYKKSLAQAYLEQGDIFSALKDKDKAQESYGKAAKLGNVQAQEKLAVLMNPVSTSSPNIQNVQAREKPAVSAEPVSASGSETKLEVGNLVVSFSSPNIQNVQAREKPAVSAEPVSASSSETKLEVGNLVVSFVTQPSWPSNLPQVFLQTLLPDAQEDKLDSKAE